MSRFSGKVSFFKDVVATSTIVYCLKNRYLSS